MGRLVYSLGMSLDGFVEDASGNFDWSEPPEDLHEIANERAREASAFLFGRRMYELMEPAWTDMAERDDVTDVERGFAGAYVATPRVVFSDSLDEVADGVRLVRGADARAEVERLKRETDGHLELGGPGLAASLVDLIDEFAPWVAPTIVGAGKPFFPEPPSRLDLRLVEARPCERGFLALRYERAA